MGRVGESFFNAADVEAAGRVTALEAGKNFTRFIVLAGLVVEDAEGGIAAGPFGEEVYGTLQAIGGLWRIAVEGGDDAESPENFSRAGDARESLRESGFGIGEISAAELDETERKIILIVVRVSPDGVPENLRGLGRIAEMGIDVTGQREVGIVFLAFGGNGLGGFDGLRELTFAEEGVGKIEFDVVGSGIGF